MCDKCPIFTNNILFLPLSLSPSDPPDVEAFSDDIVFVPVGTGVISISCTYMGIPPVTSITWTHNASNNTLDPVADSSVSVGFSETSSMLTITEVDGESGGFYVCTPVNDVGNNSATTQVRIQCECVCVCVCVGGC